MFESENLFHLYRISSDHKRHHSIDSDASSLATVNSISTSRSKSVTTTAAELQRSLHPPGLHLDPPSPSKRIAFLRRQSHQDMIQEEDLNLLSFPTPSSRNEVKERNNGLATSVASPNIPMTTRGSPASGLPIPTTKSSSPFAVTSSLPTKPSDWPSSFPSSRPLGSRSNSVVAAWESPSSVQVSPAHSRLPLPQPRSPFAGFDRALYGDEREGRWDRDGNSQLERETSLGSASGRSASLSAANVTGGIGLSNMSPFAGNTLMLFGDLGNAAGSRRPREYSVGGLGRRWDMGLGRGALREEAIEDGDEDEEGVRMMGGKSGATSRRHSLAAFEGRRNAPGGFGSKNTLSRSGLNEEMNDGLEEQFNSLQLDLDPISQVPASAKVEQAIQPPRKQQSIGSMGGTGNQTTGVAGYCPPRQSRAVSVGSLSPRSFGHIGQPLPPTNPLGMAAPFTSTGFNGGFQQQQSARFIPSTVNMATPSYFSPNFQATPTMVMPPPTSPPSFFPTNAPASAGQSVPPPANATSISNEMVDLGKGIPLHSIPSNATMYIVEFKAGRTDLFYSADPDVTIKNGDLVIVEADRGKDLGKVRHDSVTLDEVHAFQQSQVEMALGQLAAAPQGSHAPNPHQIARMTKELHPKKLYGKAKPEDMTLLISKAQDEAKALAVCRSKVLQKNLPMEVTDAEWQFDRRKLTFFFVADRRIDFRELVRELFRTFKTRIWMCLLTNEGIAPNQVPGGM